MSWKLILIELTCQLMAHVMYLGDEDLFSLSSGVRWRDSNMSEDDSEMKTIHSGITHMRGNNQSPDFWSTRVCNYKKKNWREISFPLETDDNTGHATLRSLVVLEVLVLSSTIDVCFH